jgi:hypothetical protein
VLDRRGPAAQLFIVAGMLGVATTVLVAWGCSLWAPLGPSTNYGGPCPTDPARCAKFLGPAVEYADPTWLRPEPATVVIYIKEVALGAGVNVTRLTVAREDLSSRGSSDVGLWRAGWPLPALRCAVRVQDWDDRKRRDWPGAVNAPWWLGPRPIRPLDPLGFFMRARPLPLRPEPVGFLINSVMWGSLAFSMPMLASIRHAIRCRRNHCPACGYDLSGSTTGTCPECGKAAHA